MVVAAIISIMLTVPKRRTKTDAAAGSAR